MTGISSSSFLRRSQNAEAVPFGEPQIRQDEDRLRVVQRTHRFRLVARLHDLVPVTLQRMTEHRAQRILVFDDQDAGGVGHSPGRSQRSQPGGTPARRASSSISSIFFFCSSTSDRTRSSSAIAFWRSSPMRAR